ncbi:protein mono-ADP-ribosyltransferase PARP11-like [Scomber scombrus]|uniref:protein mono-ADP-ribosyltransferase PARP11-like n=1 Tax=Scomber scombrus TaxID=13677 RepID=UPI002DDB33B3|nr:protein mono-ADP-ribosyltransferase PARP11-like [Scomber scombrus]
MFILIAAFVVILVGCIFIIYLKRKYITGLVVRTKQAMEVMLSDFQNTFNQDPASVVTHSTSNDLKPQWEFAGKRGRWHDFREKTDPPNKCSVTINDIESWYQEKPHDKMPFTVNGDSYELDFNKMIQTQVKDNSQYSIRRELVPLHAHV